MVRPRSDRPPPFAPVALRSADDGGRHVTYFHVPRIVRPTRVRLVQALVVLGNLALIPGAQFVIETGRPRFVGLFGYVLIAVLLFDLVYLIDYFSDWRATTSWWSLPALLADRRLPAIFLLAGITSFTTLGRGLPSYLLLALVYVTLLVRITRVDLDERSVIPELLLVLTGFATLIASQVLTVPYYADTADTVVHTTYATQVATSGTLEGLVGTRYFRFPFYHVWNAVGIQLTDLWPRHAVALLSIALFSTVIVLVYLLVRNWLGSKRLGLTAAVLTSVTPAFIEWASKAHAQSLSFFFFAAFLLLLFGFSDRRRILLCVPLLGAWVVTHHLSVAMAIVLLGLPVVAATLLFGLRTIDVASLARRPLLLYATFVTVVVAYWTIVTTYIYEPFGWIFLYSPAAEGVPSLQYVIQQYEDPRALVAASVPYVVDNLDFALLLMVAGVGFWAVLSTRRIESLRWKVALAGFVPGAAMFFPNPAWIPLEGLATVNRWAIMTLPLTIPVFAVGLQRLCSLASNRSLRGGVTAVIVFLVVFTSLTTGMANPTFTELNGINKYPRFYISDHDMAAIEFTQSHTVDGEVVHTAVPIASYLQKTPWPGEAGERASVPQLTANGLDGHIQICPGVTLFPTEAFYDDGIRITFHDVLGEAYSEDVSVSDVAIPSEVGWNPGGVSQVYSNRGTELYYATTDNPDLGRTCPSQFG